VGEVTRRVLCAPRTTSRKPLVLRDAIAEAPRAELPLEQRAVATSERCACGNVYGDGREVHQELRGGALVAFCEGCA